MLDPLTFTATLWPWKERSDTWFFVTVPIEVAEQIAAILLPPRGFGSVRVAVTVGGTTWQTSVFPDKEGTYSLPIKKAVRTAEGLRDDGEVDVHLDILGT